MSIIKWEIGIFSKNTMFNHFILLNENLKSKVDISQGDGFLKENHEDITKIQELSIIIKKFKTPTYKKKQKLDYKTF